MRGCYPYCRYLLPLNLICVILSYGRDTKREEEFRINSWYFARVPFGKRSVERCIWELNLGITLQISHLYYKFDNKNSLHIIYYNIITVVVIFDLIAVITVSSQARGGGPGTRLQA